MPLLARLSLKQQVAYPEHLHGAILQDVAPSCPEGIIVGSASFDVLEAGDMVEGCSIGFWFGFCGFEPVRSTFCALAGFLDLRLRRRFRGDRRTVLFV